MPPGLTMFACQRTIHSHSRPPESESLMSERTVKQIIEGQEPVTASANTTVQEAARLMKRKNVGALMVVDGDKLVGVFTERDGLFRVIAEGLDTTRTELAAVMTA